MLKSSVRAIDELRVKELQSRSVSGRRNRSAIGQKQTFLVHISAD
jgi:hypothetical protein